MRRRLPLLLAVLAVVMLAVGGVGLWRAHSLRSIPAAANDAVVDAVTSAEVESDVSSALTKVLSYDYSDPSATEQAADQLLAGDARKEYDTLFASLQERAPGQQLVLSATVQAVAVKELAGDQATLLVFVDQTSQRASDSEASISAAQLSIEAKRSGGSWLITGLTPL
ncbi:hypothetical protein [Nocardioides sp.]|uniref:hypothetical protein n=1 Tax=Nocardioides sp. TaxID=35761 RepID=UPI0039E4C315